MGDAGSRPLRVVIGQACSLTFGPWAYVQLLMILVLMRLSLFRVPIHGSLTPWLLVLSPVYLPLAPVGRTAGSPRARPRRRWKRCNGPMGILLPSVLLSPATIFTDRVGLPFAAARSVFVCASGDAHFNQNCQRES